MDFVSNKQTNQKQRKKRKTFEEKNFLGREHSRKGASGYEPQHAWARCPSGTSGPERIFDAKRGHPTPGFGPVLGANCARRFA